MKGKVLLAADEVGCLFNVATLLREEGYQVEICNEGPRFLQAIQDCEPDLGVLCATLPLWDAFALGREAKSDPATAALPLLLITRSWSQVAQETLPDDAPAADIHMVYPFDAAEFLAHIRALQQLGDTRRALQRRENELSALRQVSKAVAGIAKLEDILQAALVTVNQALGLESGAVYLVRENQATLEMILSMGIPGGLAKLLSSLPAKLLISNRMQRENHAEACLVTGLRQSMIKPALINEGYKLVAGVPLMSKGQLRGMLAIGSREIESLPERHLELLTAIGHQVGLALESAQLYDALQQERDFATMLLDTMAEGLLVQDLEGRITFANPAASRMLDMANWELVGRKLLELLPSEERARIDAEIEGCIHGTARVFETTLRAQTGRLIPVLANATPLFEGNECRGILAVLMDIAALREAECASRESEERYRVLAEESPFGILIVQGNQVLYRNRRAEDWWNGGADLDQAFSRVNDRDRAWLRDWVARQMDDQDPSPIQLSMNDPQTGEQRWFVLRASPIHYSSRQARLITAIDVTEQKLAEQALLRAERLRALGQMSGGIAHNFNNILVSIQGHLDLAARDRENPQALAEYLERIRLGTQDAAQAVRRLQSLYRVLEDTSDFVPVDLSRIAQDAIELTQPRWRDERQRDGVTIQVVTDFQAQSAVGGNPSELREVTTNLILNAIDAMPRGGVLAISTRDQGDMVELQVRDTGVGISPQRLSKIWEPFYTSKGATGSGLGLSISQRAIERHGGRISAQSVLGEGSVFTILLPTSAVKPVPAPAVVQRDVPEGYHILVVDDEPTVVQLLQRILVREGQQVTTVMSGREALSVLEDHPFSMVITDLGMPDISGAMVAQRARELYPDMPVVLATGWGDTLTPEQLAEMGIQHLLPKPFTYDQVRQLLAERLPPAA